MKTFIGLSILILIIMLILCIVFLIIHENRVREHKEEDSNMVTSKGFYIAIVFIVSLTIFMLIFLYFNERQNEKSKRLQRVRLLNRKKSYNRQFISGMNKKPISQKPLSPLEKMWFNAFNKANK
jgi:hypothetical protein